MDEAVRELVRDWLTRASHDLQAARTLAASSEPLLDVAILPLSAGSGEGSQRIAAIARRSLPEDARHRRTTQATRLNGAFSQFGASAAVWTPYVSAFRYPGGSDEPMPTSDQFNEALQLAQAIYDFVLDLLPARRGHEKTGGDGNSGTGLNANRHLFP
jgi:hypothetical protein